MGKAGPLIGLTSIGFGVLLLWSAYTKKPLFGKGGLIPSFFATGSFEDAGKAAGKTLQDLAKTYKPSSTPPNNPPPGKTVET